MPLQPPSRSSLVSVAFGLALLFLGPAALLGQVASAGMPTLAAGSFGRLEARLSDALRARDARALRAILAKDFELRDSGNPSELTLRDDFVANAAHGSAVACKVEQLMPRLFRDTAVISFVCTSPSGNNGGARLAVDVWRKTGKDWKLAARYLGGDVSAPAATTISK